MKFGGKVVQGVQVGAKFGIATANIDLFKAIELEEGVYLVHIDIEGKTYDGLLHFGKRKTFGGDLSVEVHILDFDRDIYGAEVEVQVLEFLREVKKFANGDALFTQIEKDVVGARKYFLRKKIVQKWGSFSPQDVQKKSEHILQKIENNQFFQQHENILIYAPIKHEFSFVEEFCKKNPRKNFYFPRIENGQMDFYAAKYRELERGNFGILEPKKSAEKFTESSRFLCFVPGLAADKDGNRLGRGGGFYDRFLTNMRKKSADFSTIIVLPEFAYFQEVPHESHDQKVDEIILV